MKPQEFIDQIAPDAMACHLKTDIPASFTIAQAALESGWGTSKTAAMAHNLFNIKADKSWHGPVYQMSSTEYVGGNNVLVPANWRMYLDWLSCMNDRAAFFRANPRYAKCFSETTGEGWCRAVAAAGYATDPDYAQKLIVTIRARNLTQFDKPKEVA